MSSLKDSTYIEQVAFNWQLWDRDIFSEENIADSPAGNNRKSIRYVRKDIAVFVSKPDVFGCYSFFKSSRVTRVKLFDISSRGVLIAGSLLLKLKKNQKVKLTLIFQTNKSFEFSARVVREVTEQRKLYGIKFDKTNIELGEYLFESQEDMKFKL